MCKPLQVAGIVNDSITDGPGLRFTLFLQGCDKRCEGCHNPSSWDTQGGSLMQPEEILRKIAGNPLLSGVTLSGGEPFLQAEALLPVARQVKAMGLELAAYTGDVFEELYGRNDPAIKELIALCDVIVDGPFILKQRNLTLRFRGSENQRIINVPRTLSQGHVMLEESARWGGSSAAN